MRADDQAGIIGGERLARRSPSNGPPGGRSSCDATNDTYLGRFRSSQGETAGLDFDRATGKLYIWHNIGPNFLEVTSLRSTRQGDERKLDTVQEYTGPRPGNLEGFAVGPAGTCLVTDDDNAQNEGVTLYRRFKP